MTYCIDLQIACDSPLPFPEHQLIQWATAALSANVKQGEITLRFVEPQEIQSLNHQYRNQPKTTNVLAFPSEIPDDIPLDVPFLGDVIICPLVLKAESQELKRPLEAHWAHIILHGVLHLLGYDHIEPNDETKMQALEIELLRQLGYNNPYQIEENSCD